MAELSSPAHLSDHQLLVEIKHLAGRERQATARLIASLMELDARRLYLGEGCSSLFTYCTQVLHLSEHAAYGRIAAARAARRFPVILELLADGSINVTTVGLLAAHLTSDNHRAVLDEARQQSKRAVEQLVARLQPRPAVPCSVRKLPVPAAVKPSATEPATDLQAGVSAAFSPALPTAPTRRPAVIRPLAPERYKVQLTVSRETYEKLRRAQDLLRHRIPNGDAAAIFDRALTVLLENLEKEKLAAARQPRQGRASLPRSRHIPAAVKRAVWARDGGRCAFVGTEGRCAERGFLEFHHVVPYAAGGEATLENIEIRCRSHNAHEAKRFFGPELAREARATYCSSSDRADPFSLFLTSSVRTEDVSDQPACVGSQEIKRSREQKLAYLDTVFERTSRTISFHLQLQPDNAEAGRLAALVLLQRKARGLDAMSDMLGALRQRAGPQDQVLLDRLSETTARFARLALNGPGKTPVGDHRRALLELRDSKEKLETEIGRHFDAFRAESDPVTLDGVRSAVPGDAALIEFALYRHFNPRSPSMSTAHAAPRYAAYVIRPNAETVGRDLGNAAAVDAAIERFRESLENPDSTDLSRRAREKTDSIPKREQ